MSNPCSRQDRDKLRWVCDEYGLELGALLKENCMQEQNKTKVELLYAYIKIK